MNPTSQPASRWWVVALLVGHAALTGLAVWAAELTSRFAATLGEYQEAFEFGIPFAQVSLLGFWAAHGGERTLVRLVVSVTALLLVWLIVYCRFSHGYEFDRDALMLLAVQASCLALIFTLGQRWRGWRLVRYQPDEAPRPVERLQFGVRDLFWWTSLSAGMIALSRWMLPYLQRDVPELFPLIAVVAVDLLGVVPLMATVLRSRGDWAAGGVAMSLAWLAALSYGESQVFYSWDGATGNHNYVAFFFCLNGIQASIVLGTLMVVRASGWRCIKA